MKILVTGGAGFIGSHLVDGLLGEGHEVAVLDDLSTGRKENLSAEARFENQDIADSRIVSLFEEIKPEIVFHLAAIPRVPISVEDPVSTSRANILGTVQVFKAALDAGAKRVVFASSSSVYGNQECLPLAETMTPNPVSPYGLQKLTGEQFAVLFSKLYDLPMISLRYFNVYGPRIDVASGYSLVFGTFLRQQKAGEPLTIFGDGEQTRGFCYVDDVVEANLRAMNSEKVQGGEVINIGSKEATSINQLADMLGGEKKYLPPRKGDVRHTKADITRAQELLGWEPTVSFEDGVERTRQWFLSVQDTEGL